MQLATDDIQAQGWAPSDPYLASPFNIGWPLEPLADIPNSTDVRQLELSELMPGFWRQGVEGNFGAGAQINTGGSMPTDGNDALAPSREMYERYTMTAGSARLALNTRWKSPCGHVEKLLGRLMPPVPIGTYDVEFNDSDARQSMVYNSTGFWPGKDSC
jgi:hypothetical protein